MFIAKQFVLQSICYAYVALTVKIPIARSWINVVVNHLKHPILFIAYRCQYGMLLKEMRLYCRALTFWATTLVFEAGCVTPSFLQGICELVKIKRINIHTSTFTLVKIDMKSLYAPSILLY